MDEFIVTCACGQQKLVSGFAFGMRDTCSRCGAAMEINETTAVPRTQPPQATPQPAADPSSHAEAAAQSPPAAPPEPIDPPRNVCARCGKKFRGDWDRLETGEGAICYICSNQGAVGTPERLKPENVETVAPVVQPGKEKPNLESPTPLPNFLGFETESPGFKRAITIAGFTVIGLTFVLVMFGGLGVPEDASRMPTIMNQSQETEGSLALGIVLAVWEFISVFAAGLLAVYLYHRSTDKLDHNVLWMDLLEISWPILQLTVIHFTLWLLFGPYLSIISIIAAYWIFTKYFNFWIKEFIIVYILYRIIGVVISALGYGFFGLIANLFM